MSIRPCFLAGQFLAALSAMALCSATASSAAEGAKKITFKKFQLDQKFRSEGVAVGDFNKDGKLDISAGSVYYAAPDWKLVSILDKPAEFDGAKGYSNSFNNFAVDVNADGWTDLVVVDFPGAATWWFQNPGTAAGPWTKHVLTPVTNNESPQMVDIDGDGKLELVAGVSPDPKNSDGPERRMAIIRPSDKATEPWTVTPISAAGAHGTMRFSHGLGIGDVNKDGRNDVIVPQGWWESPADKTTAEWKFYAAPLGANCADMYAYDFDGDGDNDVLSSSAHDAGIWWHEQTAEGWKTHLIDDSFSQTHSLCFADIDGDGLPDFVTGKRFWAHGPTGDKDPNKPAVMYWFQLSRKDGRPVWTQHQFDHDSGVGTQFQVADVNGDGLLDVVTANKKGAHYFQQARE